MNTLGLKFDLPVGFKIKGEYVKNVELLPSNSIAEEVFTSKIAQKPFTWIARVIAVATGSIGDTKIAEAVRDEYYKTSKITIPKVILDMPWADANTMLLEIHRRVWENEVRDMETMCRHCSKSIVVDVDLNRIEMPEKNLLLIEEAGEFDGISVPLDPFKLTRLLSQARSEELKELANTEFNEIVFRIPTLGDALKNERYFDRNIELWRRVGADCLESIRSVSREEGEDEIVTSIPSNFNTLLGIKIYKELTAKNLKTIRHELRESLPVIPFAYKDECPCDLNREIPFALDPSGFFSE